jgi:hypothetical protein
LKITISNSSKSPVSSSLSNKIDAKKLIPLFNICAKIEVPRISDEYYVSLNTAKRGQYKKATRYPYSFVLPNGLTENYAISLIDGANLDHWNECVTDGQIVMYNGNEYKFYVYYTDVAYPVLTDETMPFTLKLIKK